MSGPIEFKACRKCGHVKSLSDFHADKARHDGRVADCKACKREYFQRYYAGNKGAIISRTRAYLAAHPEVAASAKRTWAAANRARESASARVRHEARYRADVDYRLSFIIRGHLKRCLAGGKPSYRSAELRQRIEMNFAPGMHWGNYGEWHIDHRVPVSVMLKRGRSAAQINCLANLMPLWATENLSKGARLAA